MAWDSDESKKEVGAETEDDSSATSTESHETEVWDEETVAAVSRTTHKQMQQRQPILIGCNRDGTINVQLPNGSIIVAEASAFPSFGAKISVQQGTTPNVLEHSHPVEKRTTDRIPHEWEMEQVLPSTASAVFHVFHRRVNVRMYYFRV